MPTPISLALLFVAASALAGSAAAEPAFPPARPVGVAAGGGAASPRAPATDPFVQGTRTPKVPEPPAAAAAEATPVNLLTTLETWSVSQADFVALLDGPADGRVPYDKIEEFEKAGRARLLGLMSVVCPSGQRAVLESIDEVRYGSEFSVAARTGELPFPEQFVTRNTGDTLELEAVVGPDGKTIDLTVSAQTVRLAGFEESRAEAGALPVSQPKFESEKVTTDLSLQSGRPAFLATASPVSGADAPEGREVRLQIIRTTVQAAPRPPAPLPEIAHVRLEFLFYQLDRSAARRLLNESADSAQSHARVREMVGRGEASLERVVAFVCKSGNRAVNEEIVEFRYATMLMPPAFLAPTAAPEPRQPASLRSFETRNTGVTVEAEPAVDRGLFVMTNVAPQVVALAGMLKADGIAAKYPPQPVFTTRKLSTSATTGLGVPVLLGTMSPPRENGVNGRKDEGHTGLVYLRVTPIVP